MKRNVMNNMQHILSLLSVLLMTTAAAADEIKGVRPDFKNRFRG
jgi:hypothetical protein